MTPTVPSNELVGELAGAYAACRAIAKREAKNFYYAFLALPLERRNAICSVYAFMRQADDLADDETLPRDERRRNLDAWLAAWHQAAAGNATADPVFLAVRDATARFTIPLHLLDELVDGVAMDLDRAGESAHATNDAPCPVLSTSFVERAGSPEAPPDTYATFADLYRYCYLVASVVGLVCIRIFGYSDERAEKLAEETGIAFQLTNILRDVREDAERGRIYLPLDDMAAAGTNTEALMLAVRGEQPSPGLMTLLHTEIAHAEQYYRASEELTPLLEPDAQPAMRVLVSIYHRLLDRIAASPAAVFRERVSVPTPQKLAILAPGLLRSFVARVFG